MRADDDGVAGLERDQYLVDGGGRGIGGGQDGRHNAHRSADLDDLFFGDLADDADGFHAAHAAREPVGGKQVLDVLIFGVAVAGFFHGHVGEVFGIGARGGSHAFDNRIDLFLRERAVLLPSCECLLDLGADLLDRDKVFVREHRTLLLQAAGGQDLLDLVVRAGDDVDADELTDAPGRGRTRVRGGFDRADIAADRDTDQAGADEFLAGQDHVGGLDHGIGGFDGAYQTFCFNQAKGLHFSSSVAMKSYTSTIGGGGSRGSPKEECAAAFRAVGQTSRPVLACQKWVGSGPACAVESERQARRPVPPTKKKWFQVIRFPASPTTGMHGTELRVQERRTFRLSAPLVPFSPAPGSMLRDFAAAFCLLSSTEPGARNGLSLAYNGCRLSAASIPGSAFLACSFAPCPKASLPVRPFCSIPFAGSPRSMATSMRLARCSSASRLDWPLPLPPLPFGTLTDRKSVV